MPFKDPERQRAAIRESMRKRRAADPEWVKEQNKLRWVGADLDTKRATQRRWWAAHRAEMSERRRAEYAADERRREQAKEAAYRRRAVRHGVTIAPVSQRAIRERDGGICGLCGLPVDPELRHPDPLSASLDHIVPLAKGGTHEPSNVQLAHLGCNQAKGVKHRSG